MFAPISASAEPHTHDGFFMRLGLDLGPALVDLESGASYSGVQIGEDFMLGGTILPRLVIGGGLLLAHTTAPTVSFGGTEYQQDGTMMFGGAHAFTSYYFNATRGGHVQGLVGLSMLDYVTSSTVDPGTDPTGPVFGIGGGYDFWIGREWSMGPVARILYAPVSSGGASAQYLYPSVGVALTLH